jgi:SOS response regulatory protein OraA/RecX
LDALLNNLVRCLCLDQRFANEFIQMRFNQGKGPIKIATDLKQRGIDNFDEDGDLAHEFYEEVIDKGHSRMKRQVRNLRPQVN